MEIERQFGARLRELRKAGGLTQQRLGEAADLSYKYIGAIERGEQSPTIGTVSALASALGVEPRDLFTFRHNQPDPRALKKELNRLLKDADLATLQQAVKLLHALRV